MDRNSTQQEILLMTGTSFVSGQWQKKDDGGEDDQMTGTQRLEEAIWNGLLQEMLPEICVGSLHRIFLWKVREGANFLDLELGETPVAIDPQSSIDPYTFLGEQAYN
jgi:hypothetical protein